MLKNGTAEMYRKYKFDYGVMIGEGSYGKVFKGVNNDTQQEVAVKVQEYQERDEFEQIELEVKALHKLNHPHIVGYIDGYIGISKVFIIMEYIEGGLSLSDLVVKPGASEEDGVGFITVTERDVRHIIYQCLDALYFAMQHKICHRDVKLENILVRNWETFDVVLADFNLSKKLVQHKQLMTTTCGTDGFIAPEISKGKAYNYKCDIWSVGVTLYALLSWGFPPYYKNQDSISEYAFSFINMKDTTLDFPETEQFDHVSEEAKVLLEGMLRIDPSKRFSYKKIKRMAWIKDESCANSEFNLNLHARERLKQENN